MGSRSDAGKRIELQQAKQRIHRRRRPDSALPTARRRVDDYWLKAALWRHSDSLAVRHSGRSPGRPSPVRRCSTDPPTPPASTTSSPPPLPSPKCQPSRRLLPTYQAVGITVGDHPMAQFRPRRLTSHGVRSAADARRIRQRGPGAYRRRNHRSPAPRDRQGSACSSRWRTRPAWCKRSCPPTSCIDTGRYCSALRESSSRALLQRRDGSVSVQARRFWPLEIGPVSSHDFH